MFTVFHACYTIHFKIQSDVVQQMLVYIAHPLNPYKKYQALK